MKTHFFSGKDGLKHGLLLSILLLSACAASPQVVEAEQAHRPAAPPAAAPAAAQKPATVEAQQPAPPPQVDIQPKKRKYNVEED
jgi:hypothetical protein